MDSWNNQSFCYNCNVSIVKSHVCDGSTAVFRDKFKTVFVEETEGFILRKHIITKNYRKYILKENMSDICRKYKAQRETIKHILNGCSNLAENKYLDITLQNCD